MGTACGVAGKATMELWFWIDNRQVFCSRSKVRFPSLFAFLLSLSFFTCDVSVLHDTRSFPAFSLFLYPTRFPPFLSVSFYHSSSLSFHFCSSLFFKSSLHLHLSFLHIPPSSFIFISLLYILLYFSSIFFHLPSYLYYFVSVFLHLLSITFILSSSISFHFIYLSIPFHLPHPSLFLPHSLVPTAIQPRTSNNRAS